MKTKLTALLLAVIFTFSLATQALAEVSILDFAYILDEVRTKFIGRELSEEEIMDAALYGVFDILDKYSNYMVNDQAESFTEAITGKIQGVGVIVSLNKNGQLEIVRTIVNSPAEKAGLLPKDIIIQINGTSTKGLPADAGTALIKNSPSSKIALKVLREGKEVDIAVERGDITRESVIVSKVENILEGAAPDNKTRYIAIPEINDDTAEIFKTVVERLKGEGVSKIIIDLRGNLGGYVNVATDILRQLIPNDTLYLFKNYSGAITKVSSTLDKAPFEKIFVIIDSNTMSAAEVIAMCLQDSAKATVIGKTSYGKGISQEVNKIEDNRYYTITSAEVLRKDGKKLHGVGVKPDIEVDYPGFITEEITFDKMNTPNPRLIEQLKKVLVYLNGTKLEINGSYDAPTKEALKKIADESGIDSSNLITSAIMNVINLKLDINLMKSDVALKKAIEVAK